MATAIGYKKDTTKVVASKYPNHKADQKCNNCSLYQGKPGDANGPCLAVGGKLVAVAGWCSVWAKKPDKLKNLSGFLLSVYTLFDIKDYLKNL